MLNVTKTDDFSHVCLRCFSSVILCYLYMYPDLSKYKMAVCVCYAKYASRARKFLNKSFRFVICF